MSFLYCSNFFCRKFFKIRLTFTEVIRDHFGTCIKDRHVAFVFMNTLYNNFPFTSKLVHEVDKCILIGCYLG